MTELLTRPICTPENSFPEIPTQQFVEVLLTFAQATAEKNYFPYQKVYGARIIEAVLHHEGCELTALFARQTGKTEVTGGVSAAMAVLLPYFANLYPDDWRFNFTPKLGLYQGYADGIKIGIYAPKKDQSDISYRRMLNCFSTKTGILALQELGIFCDTSNRKNTVLSNGSRIWCDTAGEKANVEGETFHVMILEECQDINDFKIEKSLSPMVAFNNGVQIKVGTCSIEKGNFYYTIKNNQREFREGAIHRRRHFFFPYQVAIKYNPSYAAYVETQKRRYGADSDSFRLSYECRWMFERGQFITEDLLFGPKVALTSGPFSTRWEKTPEVMRLEYNGKIHSYKCVAGIDFGKVSDSTVVTIGAVDFHNPVYHGIIKEDGIDREVYLYEKHILNWLEMTGDNYELQYKRIKRFLSQYKNLISVVVDATAGQDMMADRMAAEFAVPVNAISMQQATQSEMNKNFYGDLESGRFTFPFCAAVRRDEEVKNFVKTMLGVQKSYTKGYLNVYAPEDDVHAHDDYYDSGNLCVHGCSFAPGDLEVEVFDSNIFLR